MRKALIVGIDHYENVSTLYGCVHDAQSVKRVIERHYDGQRNFDVRLLISNGPSYSIDRETLRQAIVDLFHDDSEIALLYFAGHGYIEPVGGYICSSDTRSGNDGIPLSEVVGFANQSGAQNKVIILDSCHSGVAGRSSSSSTSELSTGLTILTASTEQQYASEENQSGVFTMLLVDALEGAAANLLGEVTPGSVYAHVDQSLGAWAQRPVFKTNVKKFVYLRRTEPPVSLADLRKIAELFPTAGFLFSLDPSYEPERFPGDELKPEYNPPDPNNTATFALLQKLNRVNLVVPIGAPHMWHAAMNSKACKLTALGEHYRRLVEKDLI